MDPSINIIPHPRECTLHKRYVNLEDGWEISAQGDSASALAAQFQKLFPPCPPAGGNKRCCLVKMDDMLPEAYDIEICPKKITIAASGESGFFYAFQTLKQLEYMRRLPEGVIKDSPALKTRGFYLVLQSTRKLDFKSLKQIIEKAGELKLNTIFIEYGDRFPYLKNPEIPAIDTLSRKDIRALIKISKANYIKLIPVLQSFGHLDYALRHKTYSKIREVATAPEQLCPSNPESLDFFKSLAGEILEMHKDSEYFHVGGDETRQLGFCPKCMEKVKYVGKSGLFLEYIGKICAWVKSQGKIPVLWDDMLCSYPDILDKLDRDIIIMYWDYWGADGKVPYLVPRYRPAGTREIPRCIAYDKRWDGDWSNEPHPLYMRNFAEPVDLQSDLGEDFLQRFKSYLGAEFPKLINSFPYLQFYIDKGFTVWGAPSCLGEILDMSDGLENEVRCSANIRGFAHDVQQYGGMGIVTTAWYNVLPEYLYNGIILTAQSAWNGSKF